MPKVKRSRKPPPDGWELIEPTLDELDQKMREGKLVEDLDGAHNTRPSGSRREVNHHAVCGYQIMLAYTSRFL